jgi:hypothetical protein
VRRATVLIDPKASLPAPGSVRPQAPILSNVRTGSAHFSFCSSVPFDRTAPANRPTEAPKARAKPGQTRDSSIIRMAVSAAVGSPARPSAPGSGPPLRFSKAALAMSAIPSVAESSRMSAYGVMVLASSSATLGSSLWAHQARTAPWASFCSSVKSSIDLCTKGYAGASHRARPKRRGARAFALTRGATPISPKA